MRAIAAVLMGVLAWQQPAAGDLRDKLDAYLIAYEPKLSVLVADEVMTQRIKQRWMVTNRRIESEVAFVSLPANAGWMGFRRVVKVNGKGIKDRGVPLARLMAAPDRDVDTNHHPAAGCRRHENRRVGVGRAFVGRAVASAGLSQGHSHRDA